MEHLSAIFHHVLSYPFAVSSGVADVQNSHMFAAFRSNCETLVRRRYITFATCLQSVKTMSLSLSATLTFLAPPQHPVEQADLTAFALRRCGIAHE